MRDERSGERSEDRHSRQSLTQQNKKQTRIGNRVRKESSAITLSTSTLSLCNVTPLRRRRRGEGQRSVEVLSLPHLHGSRLRGRSRLMMSNPIACDMIFGDCNFLI